MAAHRVVSVSRRVRVNFDLKLQNALTNRLFSSTRYILLVLFFHHSFSSRA